jgi:glycosyltransferase involved in cell wall biosynthesis
MSSSSDAAKAGGARPLRILFVSGVSVGGAPRSTIELAGLLRARGHEVNVVVGDREHAPGWYQYGVRLAVKAGRGAVHRAVRTFLRRAGRRFEQTAELGVPVYRAPLAVNAYRAMVGQRPLDVVMANSLPREEMRWIADDLATGDARFGIYLREEHAVTHFTVTGLRPDLAISNAQEWADRIDHLVPCAVIPSVVDMAQAKVASSRETLLMVNPAASEGVDLLLEAARLCPELRFVLQESWPIAGDERAALQRALDSLENVELRAPVDTPAAVYRDARLLLALTSFGRPRVVLEAQHNGIPVVALDHPVLVEAVGAGGVVVPSGTTAAGLAEAIRTASSEPRYSQLVEASRQHAHRPDVDPDRLVRRFEDELVKVGSER